ncbi:MAG: hypothetical protein JO261_03010 [Alphaproteobacteria bacterium]|nr:hypothetical protein [Alphaproteobacteria bacterium]MBV9692649.1 hypothetical protein [Alphaproteobacteria bacterium]
MKFVFEKLREGKYDRLTVERDGRKEEIACPKIGGIPHDMVHFAVENVMGRVGFMRRVANGEALSFKMAPVVEADQMERLVEVMQADAISGFPPAADLIDMYKVTCEARGVEAYPLAERDIAALREEMTRLSKLWAATPLGGTLALEFEHQEA